MNQPVILGIHHLKFPVADLMRSLSFYENAFGARRQAHLDHRWPSGELFAVALEIDRLGTVLELRADASAAQAQKGFDPVTLSVGGREDLEAWRAHFDALGLEHSPILTGFVGWLLVVEDPDGRRLRFYTNETHGPELPFSRDERWL